ncbi:MAG: hypothetical protein E7164_02950 [Firmicutes bacterium]|nr:hypothetical protein [Bacillota bacterium]
MGNNIKELEIENIIWLIYIFISILAIVSNFYEKRFYHFRTFQDKQKYRYLNITIFVIAIIIYLYFLYRNLKHVNNGNYSFLAVFASVLFLIAGIITLYIEYQTAQDEGIAII